MSKVTVRTAALLTGKSRETINNATKDGTISYTLNSRNHKVIDIAELGRVYEIINTMDEIDNKRASNHSQIQSKSDTQDWKGLYLEAKSKTDGVLEKLELVTQHHQKERNLYEDQIENLKDSLKLSQEGHNKATLLLENKSDSTGDWQQSLKSLESRIANQEKAANTKAEAEALEKTALEKQLVEQKKTMEEQEAALKDAKDAELKREEEAEAERIRIEEDLQASQTWVSKMFGKKKTA